MESFNKQNLREIRREIDAALKVVADKHGIAFDLGRITFNANEFRGKMTVQRVGGELKTTPVETMPMTTTVFPGITNLVGRRFKFRTGMFKIDFVDPSKPKYKIKATNQNGTTYWFPVDAVTKGLIAA